MSDYSQELLDCVQPYWEAEAAITAKFFNNAPSKEDHIYWLKAQLWKELHPVDGYFSGIQKELYNLAEMFTQVDKTIDRHQYSFLIQQMLEEFNHYVLFADVLEFLTQEKIDIGKDTVQLPEEKKLQQIRHRYFTSGSPFDKAAVLFTEGGGAAMFREGAKIKGGKLEEMIARAMQVIYDDEKDHFHEGAKDASALIKNAEDVETMKQTIIAVSRQRVAMRLDMFRYPMSMEEAEAVIAKVQEDIKAKQA